LAISGYATQVYIIYKVEPRNYPYVYFGMTVIRVLYFIPLTQTTTEIFVLRFRCIVSATIYDLVHFWCTVFGKTACISYNAKHLTNADWLHWLSCYIFTRESSYCFHRVLAIAILSVRLSVRPSVRHTDGSVKIGAS